MTDFTLEWGNGRKRSYSESNCENECVYEEPTLATIRKKKIEQVHPLIYTTGDEVHFKYDEVNKVSIELFIKQIRRLVEKKYKGKSFDTNVTITYVLNTPGGCAHTALQFVDFISLLRDKYPNLKFVSVITGLVASAGTIMAVVADKRIMTANAYAMIHELSSGMYGRYTQLVSRMESTVKLMERLTNIYLKHNTVLDKEKLWTLLTRDTWYEATEYKEHGFVHEIKG